MNAFIAANLFETLGLGWEKILLYLLNFVILFVGLTFLLFKPIRKFMAKRQEEVKNEVNAAEKIKEEAEERVAEGERKVQEANEEVKKKSSEIEQEKLVALHERERILAEARKEAEEIRKNALAEADKEREKAVLAAKEDMADLAVIMAKNILEREITPTDNEKLIDDCLKELKGND